MNMMKIFIWSLLTLFIGIGVSCTDEIIMANEDGQYTRQFISDLDGFGEEKASILQRNNVDEQEFIRLSTDSAWALPASEQAMLKSIRGDVSHPDERTLLQKVIPLEDLTVYMDNKYGGTVGGFVCEAADVKSLKTMHEVYWGLRLDYEGTKFKADGAGYAVIRFYSEYISGLQVPYVAELGGTQTHSWPNGGGGFITSTLGEGGYPEWTFDGYYAPVEGAELYEVTPQGREILRSVYYAGRWQTYEGADWQPSRQAGVTHQPRLCDYRDHTFMVRGESDDMYHLAIYKKVPLEGLEVLERGVYGLSVPACDVQNVRPL